MAPRTKKAVKAANKDTVTFTKAELVEKVKNFLEAEGACEGDWLNKVRVAFLGQKTHSVHVTLRMAASCDLEIACDGIPSDQEVTDAIRKQIDEDGTFNFDIHDDDFIVENVEIAK